MACWSTKRCSLPGWINLALVRHREPICDCGESWSQAHCLALADLDGDKQEELIAGKCIWAHNAGDPDAAEPPAAYYYTWDRATLKFTRHIIAAPGEGIALGRQFSVTDLNGDDRPDILAPSKHSFWVLFNMGYKN